MHRFINTTYSLLGRSLVVAGVVALGAAVSACDSDPEAEPDPNTLVDVAEENGFETLVAAVEAAGLVDALSGEGPFTVFAPTDDAFAALPSGTLEDLLKAENKELLADILLYHVVPGRVASEDVVKLSSATTLGGQNLSIEVRDGKVYVNDVQVVATDVEADNGIVHVIDGVLLPPQ